MIERVVIINLLRRPDRKERLERWFAEHPWPFPAPVWFEAVDASKVPVPNGWTAGGGAWGCMQSHRQVLERAMMDGVQSVLVLEDDVYFVEGFADRVTQFLGLVPNDWEQIMLGGQYVNRDGSLHREVLAPGIELVSGCERTHAYAVRGKFMRELYAKWCAASGHCDHVMGPFQKGRRVYAPTEFLAGQAEGKSDISGADNPAKLWVPPPSDLKVTLFIGEAAEARKYREKHGLHSGHNLKDEIDIGIPKLLALPEEKQAGALRDWVSMIEWEGRAKTPEKPCMMYGVPEKLARKVVGDRLKVVGGKSCGGCGTVKNAVLAAGRVAGALLAGDDVLVSDDVRKARLAICQGCEHFEKATATTMPRCRECGCFVKFKAKLATEACPVGKWGTTGQPPIATESVVGLDGDSAKPEVFWHVAAMNHWRDVVIEQLNLLVEAKLLRVKVTFLGKQLEKEWFALQAKATGVSVEILRADENIMHYETFAMLAMEQWAKSAEDGVVALYFHTKGVSAPGHDGKARWRKLMQDEVIRKWREHMRTLETLDAVGCNWWNDHFSGNFWMATARYMKTLPPFSPYHAARGLVRFTCENWIGKGLPHPRVESLAHSGVNYCEKRFFG